MKFFNFGSLAQSKIQLALLGAVLSLLSFEIWRYNQEQKQKVLAEQQTKCQQQLDNAEHFVTDSQSLHALTLGLKTRNQRPLEQPGITTRLKENQDVLLIYTAPHSLIPKEPRYENDFFEMLSKDWKNAPPPLFVSASPLDSGHALVYTACSPKPFPVPLQNLYEYFQRNDLRQAAPFGIEPF